MSHFSVLVIMSEEPTMDSLSKTLQPWHEYESTGIEDEYVIEVDVTEDANEAWARRQAQEDREPTTFEEFCADYGGWEVRDGKVWDKTNPNRKWDWWVIGGRYRDRLIDTFGASTDVMKKEDLDFARMRAKRREGREEWLAELKTCSGLELEALDKAIQTRKKLREEFQANPPEQNFWDWIKTKGEEGEVVEKLSKCWDIPQLSDGMSLTEWLDAGPTITCYAYVKDGVWHEKGEMGWFGVSTGDIDDDVWDKQVNEMVLALPDDHYIVVVDCHI